MTELFDFNAETIANEAILAPLTKGGNLPFRRLCVELGARITCGEMAYGREVLRGSPKENALLRAHESEPCFGAQIATRLPEEAAEVTKIAVDAGARWVDLNVGCPIYDTTKRGMGAALLRKPAKLGEVLSAMVEASERPVTVKIRTGWKASKINAPEVAKVAEEAGVSALILHGRTREQRYSKAADWEMIGTLREQLSIPVIGNGDVMTWYEAERFKRISGVQTVMIGRAALMKPWVFQELREGRELCLGTEERLRIYHRLATYFREHFGGDEKGRRATMRFLPWHFGFFHRYRPLPASEWQAESEQHPLIQTRFARQDATEPVAALLQDKRQVAWEALAATLFDTEDVDEALAAVAELPSTLPPPGEDDRDGHVKMAVSG